MASQLGGIGNFNYLIQCVFDDGAGKSGRNISNGCAFFLRLFYLGIHKYGTAGTKIDRVFCEQCFVCKILYTVVQGLREGFDKGTAAGGTCFIELYAIYSAVFDLDTFHILTADVENTVDFRIEECCGIVMRNRFNLTLVQHQRSFDECFAVTGGTGPGDLCGIRQFGVDFLDRADRGAERISVVVAVEGIQKSAILTNERGFCGCGTGIDSEIAVSFVSGKISRYNIVDALAGQECIVLLLVFKQRFETGNLKIDGYFFFEPFFQREKRNLGLSLCIHCRTDGCKQMRVVRHDRVLVIQF